tara:strand:- start:1674 stop:1955 length:282 start_codon:yes stop_codon:yes gene_type:complete
MSGTSTYKRKVTYTLKSGEVKTKYYDFVYHKRTPKVSQVKIKNLKRDVRAAVMKVNDHSDLLKIQKFIESLNPEILDEEEIMLPIHEAVSNLP